MKTSPLYLAFILASLHTVAHAQFFKCKGADDRYTIQDTPCATDGTPRERKRPIPGEKNESFSRPQKDNKPGANWDLDRKIPEIDRSYRTQQTAPAPAVTTRAPAGPAAKSWQEKEQDFKKRQAEDQNKAYNEQVKANNLMGECNNARQQLGILKEGRAVYSRDNKGDRQYLADENRKTEIARAEQRVANSCR